MNLSHKHLLTIDAAIEWNGYDFWFSSDMNQLTRLRQLSSNKHTPKC